MTLLSAEIRELGEIISAKFWELGEGVSVSADGEVAVVELKNRGRDSSSHRAKEGICKDFRFALAKGQKYDAFCREDLTDAHGNCPFWNVIGGCKEARIRLYCGLGQGYENRSLGEVI